MGVCQTDDSRINQRRLNPATIYQINNNKQSLKGKNSTKFEKLKMNEINCSNFININNNFNYSLVDIASNNNKNDESIEDLNLMNQPIENLPKGKEDQSLNNEIIL